jgi:hypothetical protein
MMVVYLDSRRRGNDIDSLLTVTINKRCPPLKQGERISMCRARNLATGD